MTNETQTVTTQPEVKGSGTKQKRARPSRKELIEQNQNPTTRLAGSQKTITVKVSYTSDMMRGYMETNQLQMFNAYERLAGLKRMLSRDAELSRDVDSWIEANTEILRVQLAELKEQTNKLTEGLLLEELEVNAPEHTTTFEAAHPIIHKMVKLVQHVDETLNHCESIYMQGLMDDTQLNNLRLKAIGAIRSSVDRIYKVTTPGTRSGGKYNPRDLAEWLRQGNRLAFTDTPLIAAHVVANYGVAA